MTSPLARLIDALDPTAPAKAAAITGQQSPTPEQTAADSAASAKLFGSGDADDLEVEPVYESPAPLLDDTIAELTRTVRSVLLGSPPPNRVTVYRIQRQADVAGISVQLVPPSEGRRRRVLLVCVGGYCSISDDRRDSGNPTTGDTSGFILDGRILGSTTKSLELFTTGELYASSDSTYDVRVLIEHYPDAG